MSRTRSPGPLRLRLWAGGLDSGISEDEVRAKMERFGEVGAVSIRSSARDTFAFIQFLTEEAIQNAIDHMDNSTSLGPKVRVARATQDRKHSGGAPARRPPPRDDSRGPPPRRDVRDHPRGYQDDRRQSYGERRGDSRGGRRDDRRGNGRDLPPRRDYRDDSRGRGPPQRSSGRCERDPPRRGYSPPPDRRGGRSRTPQRSDGVVRMAGKVPVGRYKITVENLPADMSWLELKDLGRDYGPTLTFARTYRHRGNWYGMLEFKSTEDAERVVRELDRRRVQGSEERLRCYLGPGPGGD